MAEASHLMSQLQIWDFDEFSMARFKSADSRGGHGAVTEVDTAAPRGQTNKSSKSKGRKIFTT